MTAHVLLLRLDGVKRTGPARWLAKCPAHDDRSPSLAIRELDDGRVLVHDFAGCATEEILTAVGLAFNDLFPPRPLKVEGARPERRPWIPSDVFAIARLEIGVVFLIASDIHKGKAVSEQDYQRLLVAADRLEHIAEATYGSR